MPRPNKMNLRGILAQMAFCSASLHGNSLFVVSDISRRQRDGSERGPEAKMRIPVQWQVAMMRHTHTTMWSIIYGDDDEESRMEIVISRMSYLAWPLPILLSGVKIDIPRRRRRHVYMGQ